MIDRSRPERYPKRTHGLTRSISAPRVGRCEGSTRERPDHPSHRAGGTHRGGVYARHRHRPTFRTPCPRGDRGPRHRADHPHDLGPGVRPGQQGLGPAERGVRAALPERDGETCEAGLQRAQDAAAARHLGAQSARRGGGQPGLARHGAARQGRSALAARQLRHGVRLERSRLAERPGREQLDARWQTVRDRQPVRLHHHGRDPGRLLQQAETRRSGARAPDHLRRVRTRPCRREASGRGADHVREQRRVPRYPRVRRHPRSHGADE